LLFSVKIGKSQTQMNRIGGVMVSVLALCVVDRGFKPRSGQTKERVRYSIRFIGCKLALFMNVDEILLATRMKKKMV
jgi:hypothetical protein